MRLKVILFSWLLLLFSLSQFILPHYIIRDLYPFFTWELYTIIQPQTHSYVIELVSLDGQDMHSCHLHLCDKINMTASHDTGIYRVIQRYGKYTEWQDGRAELYKRHIETYFLNKPKSYSYILKKITVNYLNYASGKPWEKEEIVLQVNANI